MAGMLPLEAIRHFFKLEAAGGILLVLAAILAMVMQNSGLQPLYDALLTTPVAVKVGALSLDKPLLLWINDGLMAVFFLLVGLEIKREIMQGELASREQAMLPAIAALGGIITPALIYSFINQGDEVAMRGWAIPAATDIAFALGIITLLGNRVPEGLKVCLVAIAILDDLAAIVIIALFYTDQLSMVSLALAAVAVSVLVLMNLKGVSRTAPYIVVGVILWVCVLKSGVHATLAGVVIGISIPLRATRADGKSPLVEIEHGLHPWVAYGILPVFAFANAGVSLEGITYELLFSPVTLGVALGLFFGKQIGVFCFTLLGRSLRLCRLPAGVSWKQYYAMAVVTGVGFTMSLFIGSLAFADPAMQTEVRLGVLSGSVFSSVLGYFLLRAACPLRMKD